ncbi:MAG TPA: IPT/TIG domain-containing protein [Anaeromyxobacteraceae bacterium]|nr:IPT/TIG domain-containing protein [Anaeromyxobacteraceae bacterium]
MLSFDVRGSPAAGGGLLTVAGTNLAVTSAVTFGGVRATVADFTPVGPGTGALTVMVPPASLPAGATDSFVDVVVSNPDGQSSTLAPPSSRDGTPWPANFHYGPAPTVTGFTPASGDGVAVTITGAGFSAETAGPRAGMRVVLSGPSIVSLQLPRCPDASEPACLDGVVSPTTESVLATVPSGQLRPGEYALIVVNFDGQAARAAGTFVVP